MILPNENTNLGKITDNDMKESKSITIVRDILEKNNNIKVRATEADKIPDLDGRVMIIDKYKHEAITVEIQCKTLPKEYSDTEPYKYDCDTKVFNVVLYNKTFNPVVLFLVDINRKKLYYKNITIEYAESLNIGEQESKRISFTEDNIFEESKFLSEIYSSFDVKQKTLYAGKQYFKDALIKGPNRHYSMMQEAIDLLNHKLDNEYKHIKEFCYPNVWKFGIAYNTVNDGNGFVLGLYYILKGQNDTLVKNFEINGKYILQSFSTVRGDEINAVLNSWLDDLINRYYNLCPLNIELCDDKILSEILFLFLDRLALTVKKYRKDNKYYKSTEEVKILHSYINGLINFYDDIYQNKEKSKEWSLLEPYYCATGRFLLLNPFLQFKDEQKLVDFLELNDLSEFKQHNFSGTGIDFDLIQKAIKELERRKVDSIERQDYNFDEKSIKLFFENVLNSYNFIFNKIDDKYYLPYKFHIKYNIIENAMPYKLYATSDEQFRIELDYDDSVKETEEYVLKNTNEQFGDLYKILKTKMPVYSLVKLIYYKGYLKANDRNLKYEYDTTSGTMKKMIFIDINL